MSGPLVTWPAGLLLVAAFGMNPGTAPQAGLSQGRDRTRSQQLEEARSRLLKRYLKIGRSAVFIEKKAPKMKLTLMVVGMVVLLALAACGGDDEDTASAPPTQAPAESTATPAPVPPAAPMIPATAPEPGSDEAQIMAVLEKQIRAVNTADYVAFQETCTPSAKKPPKISTLKFVFEENGGVYHPEGNMISFSPQGYNVRNVEVKMLRAPYAQVRFDIFDYDEHVGLAEYGEDVTQTKTFEKVDGRWYSEADPC